MVARALEDRRGEGGAIEGVGPRRVERDRKRVLSLGSWKTARSWSRYDRVDIRKRQKSRSEAMVYELLWVWEVEVVRVVGWC